MRLALILLIGSVAHGQTFLDHFTGTTLDARWSTAAASNGVVCANGTIAGGSGGSCPGAVSGESVAVFKSALAADGAFIYRAIDKSKSQIWLFAAQRNTTEAGGLVWMYNNASTPAVTAQATWDANARARFTFANSGITALACRKWNASHTNSEWDPATNLWSTATAFIPTIRPDSYQVFGIEIDGPGARWRALSYTQEGTGFGAQTSGLFMRSLTDWVLWSDQETTSNLWMVIGHPYNNALVTTSKIEWVYYAEGTPINYMVNGKDAASNYRITVVHGYPGLNGPPDFVIPEDRSTVAIATGSGWENSSVKDPSVVQDGSTYYAVYMGSGSKTQIGIASASSLTGTWTKAAGNPIVANSAGTNEDGVFNPTLYKDMDEPDPNQRWKLVYNGNDTSSPIKVRSYLRTCPGPPTTCTWSASTQILDVGGAAVGLTSSTCSRASNVVTCTTASSHGYIVGVPIFITGSTGCSTAINGTFYAVSGTTGSTVKFNQTASNETNCNTGGTISTYDTNGPFRSHVYRIGGIWYSFWNPHNGNETGGPTRISYATGGALTNLAKSGSLLVDSALGTPTAQCNTTITANVTASRVVTVASTTGCSADQYVLIDQDSTATNFFTNRILSVDSSTQLTMYTKMDGITSSSTPLLMAPSNAAFRDEEAYVERVGAQSWLMWDTCFGSMQGSSFIANTEWMCQRLSTTGPLGPYVPVQLNAPVMVHNGFGNDASAENIAAIRLPIPAQPRPRVGRM
jgi:hypothetical protein